MKGGGRHTMMHVNAKRNQKFASKKFDRQFQKDEVKNVKKKAQVDRKDIGNVSLSLEQRIDIVFHQIRRATFYIVFMFFFTLLSLRGLYDADVYYLSAAIRGQLEDVEFLEKHAPTWGKSYDDITTVEEWHQWLEGPFATFISPKKWSGESGQTQTPGTILRYNTILGAVRISQLRIQATDCSNGVPSALRDGGNFTWDCYSGETKGTMFGYFNKAAELRNPYGHFGWRSQKNATNSTVLQPIQFDFNGIEGETGEPLMYPKNSGGARKRYDVLAERGKSRRSYTTQKWNVYPSPAYCVTITPSHGAASVSTTVQRLVQSRYVDLHTKVVFVDMTLYNPMLDHVTWVRCSMEVTEAGGVLPSIDVETVRLWNQTTSTDRLFLYVYGVVFLCYCIFLYELVQQVRHFGVANTWARDSNKLKLANIVMFLVATSSTFYAPMLIPDVVNVESSSYVDFLPSVQYKEVAVALHAISTFLNWSALIEVLGYIPSFGIVVDTISRAKSACVGFMTIFAIVFFGFSQSYAIVYHSEMAEYRTLGNSIFSLSRALLGDFDFVQLQENHKLLGPLMFMIFVVLAIFVLLMMFVAIISDEYYAVKNEAMVKKGPRAIYFVEIWLLLQLKSLTAQRQGIARSTRRRKQKAALASLLHRQGRGRFWWCCCVCERTAALAKRSLLRLALVLLLPLKPWLSMRADRRERKAVLFIQTRFRAFMARKSVAYQKRQARLKEEGERLVAEAMAVEASAAAEAAKAEDEEEQARLREEEEARLRHRRYLALVVENRR